MNLCTNLHSINATYVYAFKFLCNLLVLLKQFTLFLWR